MDNDKLYTIDPKRYTIKKHEIFNYIPPKLFSDSEKATADKLVVDVENMTQGEPRSFIGIDVKNDSVPNMLCSYDKLLRNMEKARD